MKTVKLSDVCGLITRGISPKYTEDQSLGVAILNQKCIRNKTILYEFGKLHNLSVKSVNETKFVKSNDVLVNSTGHGTLGRTALAEAIDKPLLVDSHVTILRPVEGLFVPRYFAYLIGQSENDFIDMATGTSGQTELPRALLSEYRVSYEPSLEEQQKIVARLDAAFEKISAAEVLTRQNLDNVSALQKSILDKYLSASDSTHRLGDVITLQRGYDLPKRIRTHGEYPLASSSGIIDTHNEFKATGSGVFIGRSGSVGNVFYVEENFWPLNTTLYVKDFHGNNPKYCYWLLKNTDLKQFAGGTGVPTLNRNIVHEHMVIVAEKDDQPAIAQNIDVALGKTRKLESQYQKKLAKLTDLRQSLLAEAFITTSAV